MGSSFITTDEMFATCLLIFFFFFKLDIVWQTQAKLSLYLHLEDNTVWDLELKEGIIWPKQAEMDDETWLHG